MKAIRAIAAAVPILLAFAGLARAEAPIVGVWLRDSGTARVRIAPCGGKLCGVIVWVRDKDSPTKVGMRVFYDIVPESPTSWTGKAFNPEDGKTYVGKATVSGGSMTTQGCVLGGLICKSVSWSRAN